MKNIILSILLLTVVNLIQAQQNVVLHFNHLIESAPLQLNTGTVYNTLNGVFKVSRTEYYLSGIELVHDGGQVTALNGTYLLVNGGTADYNLGMHNVTNIEGIRFDVGVDSVSNHLDPTTYVAGHPLGPQLPSMHWGWTAGYKFLVFDGEADGTGGGVPNTTMEFHAIGDNYLTNIDLNVTNATATTGNTTTINLNADYNRLFTGVNMATIYHGQGGVMNRVIGNLATFNVFFADNTTAVKDIPTTIALSAIPNPAIDLTFIAYHFETNQSLRLLLTDQLGRTVKTVENLPSQGELELVTKDLAKGVYHYSFLADQQLIATRKLIVQ
ncbi:MbnP family protein [Aureispira anguillae]|uniref:T9SS type A sorting domain-containing protein n=1 Tax=Aureispira anguillae TaxID=2864201 RepID=A0A915VK74_9BACT|nr:MbnP family protein [Aureispira anguillae]BDS09440.1 T9SS type A sorting domain-containing protein [Aureispira anguillae]